MDGFTGNPFLDTEFEYRGHPSDGVYRRSPGLEETTERLDPVTETWAKVEPPLARSVSYDGAAIPAEQAMRLHQMRRAARPPVQIAPYTPRPAGLAPVLVKVLSVVKKLH